ncbi:Lsr2 family protein (plasmid) [Rhodococcus sp. NBC_00297]
MVLVRLIEKAGTPTSCTTNSGSSTRRRSAARSLVGNGSAAALKKGRQDLQDVRVWAKENGFEVSTRGRISHEIQDAYDAPTDVGPGRP